MNVAGGLPIALATTNYPWASWGEGDVILLGQVRERLVRVSAAGGALVPFDFDEAQGETSQSLPHFLPGGRHFI